MAAASSSSSGKVVGESVTKYFQEHAEDTFEVEDVRYYCLNIGKVTDTIVEQANTFPLLWLHPALWVVGAAHLTQKAAARVTTGCANEHWYIVLKNVTTGDSFLLEYASEGVIKGGKPLPGRNTYHLESTWYTSCTGTKRKGAKIHAFLKKSGWPTKKYNIYTGGNCQDFVKAFTKAFKNGSH